MPMKRVAVLAGAGAGDPATAAAAEEVGRLLADNGLCLVCDGDASGIAGVLAGTAAARGGRVEGIVVDGVEAHPRLTELVRVGTAAERDAEIIDRADGFLALPDAFRSISDLFSLWTEAGGSPPSKPCGLLNTGDSYTALLKVAEDEVLDRFVRESQRGMVILGRDPEALLRAMVDFRPPETRRVERRDDDW